MICGIIYRPKIWTLKSCLIIETKKRIDIHKETLILKSDNWCLTNQQCFCPLIFERHLSMIDRFLLLFVVPFFLIICCKFYSNRNASCNSSFLRATLFVPFFLFFFSLSSPSWKCPASFFQTTNCCHYLIFWRSNLFFRWFSFRFDSGNRDLSLFFLFFPVSVSVHSLSYILSSRSLLTSVWYIFPPLTYSYFFLLFLHNIISSVYILMFILLSSKKKISQFCNY